MITVPYMLFLSFLDIQLDVKNDREKESLKCGRMHIYHPQRSCEGYVFTGLCLSTRGGGGWYPSMPCRWYPNMPCSRSQGWGVLSLHALQVVSQHTLQQVSGGCLVGGGGSAPDGMHPTGMYSC